MMTGHQTTMMIVTLTTGMLAVVGSIWAVQQYGAVGVAGAAASGVILQKMVMLFVVRKKVGVWTHAGLSGFASMARLRQ